MLFSSPAVTARNLKTDWRFRLGGSGTGERPRASLAKGFELDLAGVKMLDHQAVCVQWDSLAFFPSRETVYWDGILGYDLYSRFAVDVDPAAGIVRLHPEGSDIKPIDERAERLPLMIEGLASYVVAHVQVEPNAPLVPVKLHLDTGAGSGLTLLAGSHPSLKPPAGAKKGRLLGVQGESITYRARAAVLRLGNLELNDIWFNYREKKGSGFDDGEQGRLGAGLLKRFRYIVNYPQRELILIPYPDSLEADPYLPRTGLTFKAFGERLDRLVVTDSLDGAKAAGIRAGDIILSVDGHTAYDIARHGLDEVLAAKVPGDTLQICLDESPESKCHGLVLGDE